MLPHGENLARWRLLLAHRARVARRPAAGLGLRQERRHRLVKQRRLLEIEHVAGLGEHREPRARHVLLEEQARLDAAVVLVAADDQRRDRDFGQLLRVLPDRWTAALEFALRVRRAGGVMAGEGLLEFGEAARILV